LESETFEVSSAVRSRLVSSRLVLVLVLVSSRKAGTNGGSWPGVQISLPSAGILEII
jgi:hypothetical protein